MKFKKIIKKTNKYFENAFLRIIKSSSFLFPYFITMSLFFILLESYTYPGLIFRAIFIDLKIFLGLTLLMGFTSILFSEQNKTEDFNTINIALMINRLALPVFIVFYNLLLLSQQSSYQNYIFATYHLHISRVKLLIVFSLCLLGLDLFRSFAKQFRKILLYKHRKKHYWFYAYLLSLLIVLLFLIGNVFTYIQHTAQNYRFLLKHPLASFSEKSKFMLADYEYFNFLADYSENDAVIAIPPQMSPWYTVGNGGYVRYFTYPKKVINSSLDGPLPNNANYAVIAKGSWDPGDDNLYGWPKIYIEAEKIWYFDRETNKVEESEDLFFDPSDKDNKYKWGLIKLKK